ncbi:kinase-like protein, partial [Clavulina sp. PMI_390]
EAITHSQLHHPNVIPFFGVHQDIADSHPLIILPFLEQGSLQAILTKHLLKPHDFQHVLLGIANGVEYLHSQHPPIIHGDLHPGNVLLDKIGNPYLCDFGLSRIRHEVSRSQTMRPEGGNRRFLSPELLALDRGTFFSSRESDIFALAMTFLNIWTGRRPFSEVRDDYKVAAMVKAGLRPQKTAVAVRMKPEMEAALWELLANSWAQLPDDRLASSALSQCLITIFADDDQPHPVMQGVHSILLHYTLLVMLPSISGHYSLSLNNSSPVPTAWRAFLCNWQ